MNLVNTVCWYLHTQQFEVFRIGFLYRRGPHTTVAARIAYQNWKATDVLADDVEAFCLDLLAGRIPLLEKKEVA